jgi:hypothetical protein
LQLEDRHFKWRNNHAMHAVMSSTCGDNQRRRGSTSLSSMPPVVEPSRTLPLSLTLQLSLTSRYSPSHRPPRCPPSDKPNFAHRCREKRSANVTIGLECRLASAFLTILPALVQSFPCYRFQFSAMDGIWKCHAMPIFTYQNLVFNGHSFWSGIRLAMPQARPLSPSHVYDIPTTSAYTQIVDHGPATRV